MLKKQNHSWAICKTLGFGLLVFLFVAWDNKPGDGQKDGVEIPVIYYKTGQWSESSTISRQDLSYYWRRHLL
ncbi:MAG: hypothetical protein WDO71_08550 [Bacteroidota bacterium]